MNEATLSTKIRELLVNKFGAELKIIKIHGNEFTERGTPDLLGCWRGRFIALELKVGYNQPTDIQTARLGQWRKAGAIALLVRDTDYMFVGSYLADVGSECSGWTAQRDFADHVDYMEQRS